MHLKTREKLAHVISENYQVDQTISVVLKTSARKLWRHKWFCWHMLAVKSPNYWFSSLLWTSFFNVSWANRFYLLNVQPFNVMLSLLLNNCLSTCLKNWLKMHTWCNILQTKRILENFMVPAFYEQWEMVLKCSGNNITQWEVNVLSKKLSLSNWVRNVFLLGSSKNFSHIKTVMHRCNIKTFVEAGKSSGACSYMQNYRIKCIGEKCCSFHGFMFSTTTNYRSRIDYEVQQN